MCEIADPHAEGALHPFLFLKFAVISKFSRFLDPSFTCQCFPHNPLHSVGFALVCFPVPFPLAINLHFALKHQASFRIPLNLSKCYTLSFLILCLLCFCCVLCCCTFSINLPTCHSDNLVSAFKIVIVTVTLFSTGLGPKTVRTT